MLEYIYICRHGFRSNWVDPTIKTGPTGMNRDPPLAAYGQKQASRLAAFLSDSKYPVAVEAGADPRPVPELVFSSPFYRCIETSLPTYQALKELPGGCGQGILLEHGVQEWYSTVVPDTGLHPRPASPSSLSPLFPPNSIDESYSSTYLPSRRGETLRELHDRADCFIEAWTARVEEMGVRCVVVFAHAASVIALGRALTGDKDLEVPAGCASTSLYKRKVPGQTNPTSSQWTTGKSTVDTILDKTGLSSVLKSDTESAPQLNEKSSPLPCGVGEWEPVFLGKADYLENGLERNWSFKDVVVVNGEVIEDNGDRVPHQPEDSIPTGLNDGMEKYLRRGLPKKNDQIKEIAENTVRKAELSRI